MRWHPFSPEGRGFFTAGEIEALHMPKDTPPLPPSPPRAGATGEETPPPDHAHFMAARDAGLKSMQAEMDARKVESGNILVSREWAEKMAALEAALAASAGEEVKRLVEGLDLASHRDGWARGHGHDPHADRVRPFYVVEAESALLAHVGHLAAQRDEAVRDLEAARFAPLGDNHHNAMACPYCNPQRLTPAPVSAPASTEREGEADLWRRMYNDLRASVVANTEVARSEGRAAALEEVAKVADGFKMRRDAIWLAQSERPDRERDLASEQAHRERGNEAGQIAEAIRALGPGDAPARASYKSIHYEAGE